MHRFRSLPFVAAGLALAAAPGGAVQGQDWLAFRGTLGHEWLRGDLATPLRGAIHTEWTVLGLPRWPFDWRVGLGISRVTYDPAPGFPNAPDGAVHVEDPVPSVERWNHVRWHLALGGEPIRTSWLDVYVEGRIWLGRLRSQTQLTRKNDEHPPKDPPFAHDQWASWGEELAIGLKSNFGTGLPAYLDVAVRFAALRPRGPASFNLDNHGMGDWSGGSTRNLQIGVYWKP